MLTILPKTFLAQHRLLDLNARRLAKANNKLDLISAPTEALVIPMGAIPAKDAIKLTDVDPNKAMGILRTTCVTRANRMEATEVLPEGIRNRIDRIALHLNRVVVAINFVWFRSFSHSFSDPFHWRWPISTTSMRSDVDRATFFPVHMFLRQLDSRGPNLATPLPFTVLGDLRDGVKKAFTPMASCVAFSWDHFHGPAT